MEEQSPRIPWRTMDLPNGFSLAGIRSAEPVVEIS